MPRRLDDQISAIEARLEQERARLRDLRAQQSKQERREDTRRKIIYGAAYLAGLETLSEDARARSLARVEKHITRAKDRTFLSLEPLPAPEAKTPALGGDEARDDEALTCDLPFGGGAGSTG